MTPTFRSRGGRRGSKTTPPRRTVELTWTSAGSVDEVLRDAVGRAAERLPDLRWFELTEIRGRIEDGAVTLWQVSLKLGFAGDSGESDPTARERETAEKREDGDERSWFERAPAPRRPFE